MEYLNQLAKLLLHRPSNILGAAPLVCDKPERKQICDLSEHAVLEIYLFFSYILTFGLLNAVELLEMFHTHHPPNSCAPVSLTSATSLKIHVKFADVY